MAQTAYAKINLALQVRGREPDGYHQIETIFAFAEHGDVLEAEEGDGLSLELRGPFAEALKGEPDNLVLRAARALGVTDTKLTLNKRLPIASGIGGGSADAAAVLRLLGGGRADLAQIAASLGADVPACLESRTAKGTGRGDRLETYADDRLTGKALLLVNPGVAVSTADVFKRWRGTDGGPVTKLGRNDLLAPALEVAPAIGEVLSMLQANEPELAGLSGSGATCFALYGDVERRDEAAATIAAEQPDWWQLASRLR